MLLSHKIALQPNNKQRTYFMRACGTARFAYNWALAEWKRRYDAGEKVSEGLLRRELNAIKRERFPWMMDVTKCAPQAAIMNLGDAFKRFFAGQAAYPQFHKKGVHDGFELSNDQFHVRDLKIYIPKLGNVRLRERLRFDGKIMKATVSRTADQWFVSITVELPNPTTTRENQAAVGVDVGVTDLAALSTGEKIPGPKAHTGLLKKLRMLSKSLSRKQKGSQNFKKAKAKLARLHYRISCIRNDALHKLTTQLAKTYGTIAIEDLNVAGLVKNRRLSRRIMDNAFGEFRRQLTYKTALYGSQLAVADRFFASSKICSHCGHKLDILPLSIRKWQCPMCQSTHDRDTNAAINLKHWADSSAVLMPVERAAVKPAMKQEDNAKPSVVRFG
jgi:putative transposase